jgi:hypothetical protein
MLAARVRVRRSPSSITARSATQIGAVNSSANTVASGSSVIASAQMIWPTKCTLLRTRCRPIRREVRPRPIFGRTAMSARSTASPPALRTDMISNTLRFIISARTARAAAM